MIILMMTKLFLDSHPAKLLDISAKSFFRIHYYIKAAQALDITS